MIQTVTENWKALVPSGADAFFYEETDSTNTRASATISSGRKHPAWFVAGAQNQGRGRRGRVWTSAKGNLFSSYLFFPDCDATLFSFLPFSASLAVRDCFVALGADQATVSCKWPNDVLINQKKCSGILIEAAGSGNKPKSVTIGIGLNLATAPDAPHFPATSVVGETGKTPTLKEAFAALASAVDFRLAQWRSGDVSSITQEWSSCAWGLGETRVVRTSNEEFTATLLTLGSDGGLKVRLDDGTEKQIYAADVFGAP